MKRFILLLLLGLAPFLARAETVTNILAPGSIADATEGGQGEVDLSQLTRRGVFVLQAMTSAGTTPTLDVKLQESDALTRAYEYQTAGTTVNKLRAGATTTVKLAAKFTKSGTKSIKQVALNLKYVGTITAGKLLTLTIESDNTGVPSGTALGTAGTIDVNTYVPTAAYGYVLFTFAKPVDLTDATVYHYVLAGDYTASTSNYVSWRSNTIASAGNQETQDGTTWTGVTTESFEVYSDQYTFTDVTGGGFTQVTTASSTQNRQLNVDYLKQFVRTFCTVTGGSTPTYYGGVFCVSRDMP